MQDTATIERLGSISHSLAPMMDERTLPQWQGLRTRFLGDLGEYSQEIVVLPARNQAPSGDTLAFTGLLCLEQTERQLAEPRQVHCAVPGPVPLVLLSDADVQDPVQRVLDGPGTVPSSFETLIDPVWDVGAS